MQRSERNTWGEDDRGSSLGSSLMVCLIGQCTSKFKATLSLLCFCLFLLLGKEEVVGDTRVRRGEIIAEGYSWLILLHSCFCCVMVDG